MLLPSGVLSDPIATDTSIRTTDHGTATLSQVRFAATKKWKKKKAQRLLTTVILAVIGGRVHPLNPALGHTTARRRIWKRAKRNKAEDQVHKQLPSPKIVCAEKHPESPTRNNHPGHQLTTKGISHPTPINMPLID